MAKKSTPGLGSNTAIREAIRKIALHGIANPQTDQLYDVGQIA